MTQTRQPISFVATAQPDRARAFYGDVLGLKIIESTAFALVYADGAHMLRIQIVRDLNPAPHTVHGWQVTDIAAEVAALGSKGVDFLMFDQMDQDAQGVWATPDGSKIAWFKDPCGNILSLTQFAMS